MQFDELREGDRFSLHNRRIWCIIILVSCWKRLKNEKEKRSFYTMKKLLTILLGAAMLLSLCALTACGGDPAPTADEDKPEEDTTAATTEFTTVEEGKLHMSTNAAFPPYEMTTDAGGFEGIDIDIATAIAEKLDLELVVDDMDFDAALTAAQTGKSDIVMAGVTVDEERLAVMNFTESYATGVQVIIVKEGSDVTLENLKEQMIGTQRGTTGNNYCTDDFGEEHVTAYDNGITAVQALVNDQVDCVVIDKGPATEFVAANEGLTILDTEYANEDALKELKADGTVQTILDQYIKAE